MTNKDWKTVRAQRSLDEREVLTYRRLIDAQVRLAELRQRRGVSQPNVSRIEQEDDVYLSTLSRYVAALGGYLEVRAVFPEEEITLLSEELSGE
jgi:DNA-binding Xre family transcriptional regulator